MAKIWKSSLSTRFKQRLFTATVESVLLYGCEAWTVTSKLAKELDGCYTRLLRAMRNVHWKQHMTNKELYGDLPKLSDKIRERRTRFAGHCYTATVSKLVHWIPKHGKRKQGRPTLTFVDILRQDTRLESTDMVTAMQDRKIWRAITVRGQYST
ncbi:uncharacterized protein [Amphiura filiformis]|uniref:uncharacterized protein n=1 Tax=Amphiura filiformis TaxID=82378 RepID=UPI003B2266DB